MTNSRIAQYICAFFSLIQFSFLITLNASANVGEAYGFGSRNSALGGAGVAWGADGYASYLNPAALPRTNGKRFVVSTGLLHMVPSFKPIENVVVENNYTSDRTVPRKDNIDTDYRNTTGQTLGLSYQLFPQAYHLTFGITTFMPLNQLAYMDTGPTYAPEYVMYRARTQRPQFELGLGFEMIRNTLYFGTGAHIAYSLSSSATVFLQTDSTKPSTMRFASSLKPKAAPYFGLLFTPGALSEAEEDTPVTLGLTFRMPVASANTLVLTSGARALGSDAVALDFNFGASSALYYDPLTIELGGSYAPLESVRFIAQVDYQRWKEFQAPALEIKDPKVDSCGGSSCGINISGGAPPSLNLQNIFIPRLGIENKTTDELSLRAGYAYKPSIFASLPTGAGNYLDPPKHIITAGAGYRFANFLNFPVPCTVDAHIAYHALQSQTITKTSGNEAGAGTGDQKIGAPGYVAGGKIMGGGVSLSIAL